MNTAQDNYIKSYKLAAAILHLRNLGYNVVEQSIPGLYRIDDGPEITTNQLINIALSYTSMVRFKWNFQLK